MSNSKIHRAWFESELESLGISSDSHFLLGMSGGADSTTLFYLLRLTELNFSVAHVNYNLRGQDALDDALFVEHLCQKNDIPFFQKSIDSKQQKEGNLQEWARNIRYNFFHELKEEYNFDYIVLGHHLNDQHELFLLNFVRGSGIRGLAGMKKINQDIIRPLLDIPKKDIISFLEINGLEWREDLSNAENKYQRNLIRNKVLPKLESLRGHDKGMTKTMHLVRQSEDFINSQIEQILAKHIEEHDLYFSLDIKALKEHAHSAFILHYFFGAHKNSTAITSILSSPKNGSTFLIGEKQYFYSQGKLSWAKNTCLFCINIQHSLKNKVFHLPTEKTLEYCIQNDTESISHSDNNIIHFDIDELNFPLNIRYWEHGDTFMPFGMDGKKKKVQDLFSDAKLNPIQKNQNPILTDKDDNILWVVGMRRSALAPITSETKTVLTLRYF